MNNLKKGLVVAVILLFIGVAFAPNINANISKTSVDSELIEFTTEICGLNDVKPHTVGLTKQQVKDLEHLFDEIKLKLDDASSENEVNEIINNAIINLDRNNLLPNDIDIKEVKQLFFGSNKFRTINSELVFKESSAKECFNCLIVGRTTGTVFYKGFYPPRMELHGTIIVILASLLSRFNISTEPIVSLLLNLFLLRWFFYILGGGFIKPISLGETVFFGFRNYFDEYIPAEGWVRALSSDGFMKWNGKFFGQIGGESVGITWCLKGIKNFYGIKLLGPRGFHFIGYASHVKLG